MSGNRAELERLNRLISDHESTLRILEDDSQDSTRVDALIASKQQAIEKLQQEIETLHAQKARLPSAIESVKQRLQRLRKQRTALVAAPDTEKLLNLIRKAREAGVDVEKIFRENSENSANSC